MNLESRINELEAKHFPNSVHIIYWEKYKGISKQQAIDEYCLKNNVTDLSGSLPYIVVCIPSDDEIRANIEKNKKQF